MQHTPAQLLVCAVCNLSTETYKAQWCLLNMPQVEVTLSARPEELGPWGNVIWRTCIEPCGHPTQQPGLGNGCRHDSMHEIFQITFPQGLDSSGLAVCCAAASCGGVFKVEAELLGIYACPCC